MPYDIRLSIEELRAMEAQVMGQPTDDRGTVPFLKGGMLAVIRSAIAAEMELARR